MKNDCLTIYLAGAMSNISYENQVEWRKLIKRNLMECARISDYKVNIVSPVDYYNFRKSIHQSEQEVMDFDLNKVMQSDIVIVNTTELNTSIGTAIELYEAKTNRIPVIAYDEYGIMSNVHPWLQCCISRKETNLKSLCTYIRDFYMY